MIFAQLPTDVQSLQSLFPQKYAAYIALGWVILTAGGRAITAIKNDGGLVSIWRSIVMGSSTTTQATPNNAITPSATPAPPTGLPKSILPCLVICLLLIGTGCKSTVGLAGLNVSGTFASGGKVIDAGVEVGTNSFTVDGLVSGVFGLGTNKVSGTVTVPVGSPLDTTTNK